MIKRKGKSLAIAGIALLTMLAVGCGKSREDDAATVQEENTATMQEGLPQDSAEPAATEEVKSEDSVLDWKCDRVKIAAKSALGLHGEEEISLSDVLEIKELSLFGSSGLDDLSDLSKFKNLETLDLNMSSAKDISVLSEVTGLKTLSLSDTSVSDISALSGLTELEELYLSGNSISDESIGTVTELPNLKRLSFDYMNYDKSLWEGLYANGCDVTS